MAIPTITETLVAPSSVLYSACTGQIWFYGATNDTNQAGYVQTKGGQSIVGKVNIGWDAAGSLYLIEGSTTTVTDAALNSTTTLTSATAAFTAADVGKVIAGAGIPANTVIASRSNATTVILSQAATATGTGVTVTYSTPVTLHPNTGASSDVIAAPTQTQYRVVRKIPGQKQAQEFITVTDVAGPLRLQDLLTDPPSAVGTAAMSLLAVLNATVAAGLPGDLVLADPLGSHGVSIRSASPRRSPGELLIAGDSISIGSASPGQASNTAHTDYSWVNHLVWGSRGMLHIGYNGAVGGTTTAQMLAQLPTDIAANPYAGTLIIMGGTNDSAVSISSTIANIHSMAKLGWAAGMDVWVCETLAITRAGTITNGSGMSFPQYHRALNAALRAYVRKYRGRVELIDFYRLTVDPSTDGNFLAALTVDGTHPTPTCAQTMAQLALDLLDAKISRNRSWAPTSQVETLTNALSNGLMMGALGAGTTPSGWTIFGTDATHTTYRQVAPTYLDNDPEAMLGLWWELTKDGASTTNTYISQTFTVDASTWVIGDILEIDLRCQIDPGIVNGYVDNYLSFPGATGAWANVVTGLWQVSIDGDYRDSMRVAIPAGATQVVHTCRFKSIDGNAFGGRVRFGNQALLNLTRAQNQDQYLP